jgi:RimJ/RimL family protein N-acetyltransferase
MLPSGFETARVILRPLRIDDADGIYQAWAQDPDVTRFLIWTPHHSVEDTKSYIARCVAEPPQQTRTYMLIQRGRGGLLGSLRLRRVAATRLECGYLLAKKWWGTGLMTEVLTTLVGWASTQADVKSFGAVCDIDNLASARVMEKSGLMRQGILSSWLVHPNLSPNPRDCWNYGVRFQPDGRLIGEEA